VHRLLAASLGISKLPSVFQDRLQLSSIADSMKSPSCFVELDHFVFLFSIVSNPLGEL